LQFLFYLIKKALTFMALNCCKAVVFNTRGKVMT